MPDGSLFALPSDAYAVTSDDCYTPRWVFDAMGLEFDLDVAAPLGGPWHVPAARYYTAEDDGLTAPWDGLVWCNPPYSKYRPWAERWARHDRGVLMGMTSARSMGRAVGLNGADAVAFIDVQFERQDQPTRDVPTAIFVAFRGVGAAPAERLAAADRRGAVLYGPQHGAQVLRDAAGEALNTLTGWGRAKHDVVRWLHQRADNLTGRRA